MSKKILTNKWIFINLLFIVLWTIALLVFLPGCADNDSNDIFKMILGYDFTSDWFRYSSFNDHHPLLYVFFNWTIISLIKIFGFNNFIAISVLCFIQMLICIFCFTFVCKKIYELSNNRVLLIITICFFLLNPLVVQYSLTHWKDVLFGCFILVICTQILHLCVNKKDFLNKKINIVSLILLTVICAFWRKNGIIIAVVLFVIFLIKLKELRKVFSISLVFVLLIFTISPFLKNVSGVERSHFSESVSIPIQQVAYTAKECGDLGQQQDFFNNIIPIEKMKDLYCSNTPDTIKFSPEFNDDYLDNHKFEFILNYITLGLSHFPQYIYAWAKQTESFWSIFSGTWYTVGTGVDLSESEHLQNNLLQNVISSNSLKQILDFPINWLNPIYNSAILLYVLIGTLIFLLIKNQKKFIIVLLPSLIIWLSLMFFTPACDFRYVYSLHLTIPIIIFIFWWGYKEKEKIIK